MVCLVKTGWLLRLDVVESAEEMEENDEGFLYPAEPHASCQYPHFSKFTILLYEPVGGQNNANVRRDTSRTMFRIEIVDLELHKMHDPT